MLHICLCVSMGAGCERDVQAMVCSHHDRNVKEVK